MYNVAHGSDDMAVVPEDSRETATDLAEVVRDFIAEERERPHHIYEAEVPVELDMLTGAGRVLPSSGQRDYSARIDTAIAGTIDHLLWSDGGVLTVRDWKTGRLRGFSREAARMQTRTLAVAAAAIHGAQMVAVEIAHITTSGVDIEREVLDDIGVDTHMDALLDMAARLRAGPSAPTPGPWCTEGMCPLLGDCPATKGALAAVAHEVPVFEIVNDNAETLRLMALLPRAEAALGAVKAKLKDRIKRNPPVDAAGRRYGYVEHQRREVIVRTPMQLDAIARVLGQDAAVVAVEMKPKATIASIERAARKALGGKSRGIGALRDKVLAELDKVGGVRVGTYEKAAWFWPDGAAPQAMAETAPEERRDDAGYDGE